MIAGPRAVSESFANANGYKLIDEFYDVAASGADPIPEWPGFAAILDRSFGNGIGTFLVESPDRFAREVRRELAQPRLLGIQHADDVVANLLLTDRIGGLPVGPETWMEYRVVAGSLCHSSRSALAFEQAFSICLCG